MDVKEPLQEQAKTAYISHTSTAASILMGTGLGKSKIALDLVKHYKPKKITLITNSQPLRDTNWKAEFEKFGMSEYWEITESECIQTAYKWKDRHLEFVIVDEFDVTLAPEFQKFYQNNKYDRLLALTAFIAEDKRALGETIAPVCFEFSTQDAQSANLLNKTKFVQVNFFLSNNKTREIKKKAGGSFWQSENGEYAYLEDKLQQVIIGLGKANKEAVRAELLGQEKSKDANKLEWQLKALSQKRKKLLFTSDTSAKVVKALTDEIQKNPKNKILIFSKLTAQADKLADHSYHSKNKEQNNLNKFVNGDLKTLAVCDTVNRGMNIPGVNYIIHESYIGSETDFQQKHGRGVRLGVDDTLTYFILVPWYKAWGVIPKSDGPAGRGWISCPTQAKRWLTNMSEQFDLSKLEQLTLNPDLSIPEDGRRFFNGG